MEITRARAGGHPWVLISNANTTEVQWTDPPGAQCTEYGVVSSCGADHRGGGERCSVAHHVRHVTSRRISNPHDFCHGAGRKWLSCMCLFLTPSSDARRLEELPWRKLGEVSDGLGRPPGLAHLTPIAAKVAGYVRKYPSAGFRSRARGRRIRLGCLSPGERISIATRVRRCTGTAATIYNTGRGECR